MKRIKPIEIKNDCGRWIISLIRRPYSSMMEGEGACWRDFILVDYFESRIRKLECARAARALPFVFSQKEAKRAAGRSPRPPHGTSAAGGVDTRSNPFGETPENSAIHITSNNSGARLTARNAVKSPHEPRRQRLQMLPWPSASILRCI